MIDLIVNLGAPIKMSHRTTYIIFSIYIHISYINFKCIQRRLFWYFDSHNNRGKKITIPYCRCSRPLELFWGYTWIWSTVYFADNWFHLLCEFGKENMFFSQKKSTVNDEYMDNLGSKLKIHYHIHIYAIIINNVWSVGKRFCNNQFLKKERKKFRTAFERELVGFICF